MVFFFSFGERKKKLNNILNIEGLIHSYYMKKMFPPFPSARCTPFFTFKTIFGFTFVHSTYTAEPVALVLFLIFSDY